MTARILPIFALLIAVGIFFGYLQPTYGGDIAALHKDIQDSDGALNAAKQFAAKEAQLTQQKAAIPADSLARLENYVPDSVDNVQLILDLDALAARSGVQLSDFDVEDSAPTAATTGATTFSLGSDAPTRSLDISVRAVGTYSAFRTFLAAAEGSLRPLDLVDLDLKDSSTGVYTYQITFRLYWLR